MKKSYSENNTYFYFSPWDLKDKNIKILQNKDIIIQESNKNVLSKNEENDINLVKKNLSSVEISNNVNKIQKYENNINLINKKKILSYNFTKEIFNRKILQCIRQNCNKPRLWIKSERKYSCYCTLCGSRKCNYCHYYRFYDQKDPNVLLKCKNLNCLSININICIISNCNRNKKFIKMKGIYSNYCFKCERKKCNKCNNIRLYYQDNPKLLKPCSNEFCSNNNLKN